MIEYFKNIPHAVYTTLSNFDFAMNVHGWMMNYEAGGSQNNHFEIGGYVHPELWKVWLRPDFRGTFNIKQSEVNMLKKPIRLKTSCSHNPKSSINPFLISDKVSEIVYCDRCEGYHTEMCIDHQYWCEMDSMMKYLDTNEICE